MWTKMCQEETQVFGNFSSRIKRKRSKTALLILKELHSFWKDSDFTLAYHFLKFAIFSIFFLKVSFSVPLLNIPLRIEVKNHRAKHWGKECPFHVKMEDGDKDGRWTNNSPIRTYALIGRHWWENYGRLLPNHGIWTASSVIALTQLWSSKRATSMAKDWKLSWNKTFPFILWGYTSWLLFFHIVSQRN